MRYLVIAFSLSAVSLVFADGPADNLTDKVRPVPPPGIAIPEKDRAELKKELELLQVKIAVLGDADMKPSPVVQWLPDVIIFEKAAEYALKYNEFYDLKEIAIARDLLRTGHERADHRFNRVGSAALNQDGLIPGRVRHAGKGQEASPYFLDQADELTVA